MQTQPDARASRPFFELIDLELELSDSLELNVEIAPDLIETRTVFLEDLATLVQQVDDAIELIPRHIEAAGFWNPRNRTMRPSLHGIRRVTTANLS